VKDDISALKAPQLPLGNDFTLMEGYKKPRTHARKAWELTNHMKKVLERDREQRESK